MRHQHTDHKCEKISDCSYSGKTLVEKRLFPDVEKIDKEFDPFHATFTITPEQKEKYDCHFNYLKPQAVLSEKTVRDFLRKFLPVSSVDKIWSLSDQDGDGCLDRYEWTVAIHLAIRIGDYGDPIPDQVVISLISRLGNNTQHFTASP